MGDLLTIGDWNFLAAAFCCWLVLWVPFWTSNGGLLCLVVEEPAWGIDDEPSRSGVCCPPAVDLGLGMIEPFALFALAFCWSVDECLLLNLHNSRTKQMLVSQCRIRFPTT
jgi:hypothetical protein